MTVEQVRLGLMAAAERQLVACRLLANQRPVAEDAIPYWADIDELRLDGNVRADPTTLAGSLVITREFVEDLADATSHGVPHHGVSWPETCVCLEEILVCLRDSQPVRSETLTRWRSARIAAGVRSTASGEKKWWEFWK